MTCRTWDVGTQLKVVGSREKLEIRPSTDLKSSSKLFKTSLECPPGLKIKERNLKRDE